MAIEHDELTRIVGAKSAGVAEDVVERALRPRRLDEYVGQAKIRDLPEGVGVAEGIKQALKLLAKP